MIHKARKRVLATTLLLLLCVSEIGNTYAFADEVEETSAPYESVMEETDLFEEESLIASEDEKTSLTDENSYEEESMEIAFEETLEHILETEATQEGLWDVVLDEETESSTVEMTEVSELDLSEKKNVITGFEKHGSFYPLEVSGSDRASLVKLLGRMPKTLAVELEGEEGFVLVNVSWKSLLVDYENSECFYYQFVPVFDGYELDESIDPITEVPYVAVFVDAFAKESGVSYQGLSASERDANAQTIFNFMLEEMGYNSAAACGVLANIYSECGFNPDLDGDNGTSYGICQWHNSRKTSLINYCNENGYDYRSLKGQLYYLKYELLKSYTGVNNYMLSVSDTADGSYNAGYYWCLKFEIPANTEQSSQVRGNLARDTYWPKYGNTSATGNDFTPEPATSVTETTKPVEKITLNTPKIASVSNSRNGISIKWKSISGANGYEIYRKEDGGSYKKIGVTASLSYTDTDVKSGVIYFYKIRAIRSEEEPGLETYKVIAEPSLNYRTGPGTSYSVAGSLEYGTYVKVYADYSKTADGYTWYMLKVKGGKYYASSKYLSKVASYDSGNENTGESAKSEEETILRLENPLVSLENGASGIKLSWDKVSGAESYVIFRKTGDDDYKEIKTTDKTSFYDKNVKSGNKYAYQVRASYNDTRSGYSTKSKTYLDRPEITAKQEDANVVISWKAVAGAESYYIYRRCGNESFEKIASTSSLSYSDKSVKNGNTYDYRVRAHKNSNSYPSVISSVSYSYHVELGSCSIKSVKNLKAGISLTWSKINGADSYVVYRADSKADPYVKVGTSTSTSYTDSDVVSGKKYYYKVAGVSGGASGNGLDTYEVTSSTTLNYRVGPGTSYDVAGALKSGETVLVDPDYSKTADGYTWRKIKVDGKFYYAVDHYLKLVKKAAVSTAPGEEGKMSAAQSVLRLDAPSLTVKNVTSGVKLSWKAVAGADSYFVFKKSKSGEYEPYEEVFDTSYTDTNVTSGNSYNYKLAAANGDESSASVSGKVEYLAATSVKLSESDGTIKLSWNQVNGADGYYVYRKVSGEDSYKKIKTVSASTLSYVDSNIVSGKKHSYKVKAYATDEAAFSSVVSMSIGTELKAPTGLSAEAISTGIRVSWKEAECADGYIVYRKAESDSAYSELARTTSLRYTDKKVSAGKSYSYKIASYQGEILDTCEVSCSGNLNYRVGPGTSYDVAGALKKGDQVKVVEGYLKNADGYSWSKIKISGTYYYACSDYLTLVSLGKIAKKSDYSKVVSAEAE